MSDLSAPDAKVPAPPALLRSTSNIYQIFNRELQLLESTPTRCESATSIFLIANFPFGRRTGISAVDFPCLAESFGRNIRSAARQHRAVCITLLYALGGGSL